MTRKKANLCHLLQRREMGFLHLEEKQQLKRASICLADSLLVHNNVIKTIPCIDDSSRSSYMADSNDRGIAAMTHSNRCISLIDTGLMKRVAEIDGHNRTVWTLCFHPFYPSLLATGNLGGTVCVFEKTKLIRSQANESNPITSISFHPRKPIIFYAILNRIVIWNYVEDVKMSELLAPEESRIKYVKFNPNCDMLITGIRKENLISYFGIHDEPDENDETRLISCSAFMDHLMNSLSSIIDNMESSSFVNLEFYWSHILIQTNTFYNMLESSRKIQLQPKKFIGDFNISLVLMKRRIDRIACLVINDEAVEVVDAIDQVRATDIFSIKSTLMALRYIIELYKREMRHIDIADELDFSILTDIITTIQRIMDLNEFPDMIRIYAKTVNDCQYRLQAWMMEHLQGTRMPDFFQDWRNVITYCYIHNDSTVEISKCGKLIASFRELINHQFMIAVHSLEASTLGEHLFSYKANGEETIMSLSFSPSLDYLLVGIRSNEMFGYFLRLQPNKCESNNDQIVMLRRNPTNEDVISYLKWSARPGDGIIIGYKTYQLRCLIRR